jgi:predicted DNA-binding transcriptional regulator AlpA
MPKGKKRLRSPSLQVAAYSIKEFCSAHGISISQYYRLKQSKQAPRRMRVGKRFLISAESATAWRQAREED